MNWPDLKRVFIQVLAILGLNHAAAGASQPWLQLSNASFTEPTDDSWGISYFNVQCTVINTGSQTVGIFDIANPGGITLYQAKSGISAAVVFPRPPFCVTGGDFCDLESGTSRTMDESVPVGYLSGVKGPLVASVCVQYSNGTVQEVFTAPFELPDWLVKIEVDFANAGFPKPPSGYHESKPPPPMLTAYRMALQALKDAKNNKADFSCTKAFCLKDGSWFFRFDSARALVICVTVFPDPKKTPLVSDGVPPESECDFFRQVHACGVSVCRDVAVEVFRTIRRSGIL